MYRITVAPVHIQWHTHTHTNPHTQTHTHTHTHTPIGFGRRRDPYLKTHNTQKRQTPMPPARFEPAIPTSERLHITLLVDTLFVVTVNNINKQENNDQNCFDYKNQVFSYHERTQRLTGTRITIRHTHTRISQKA